jgi:hypothetical protein
MEAEHLEIPLLDKVLCNDQKAKPFPGGNGQMASRRDRLLDDSNPSIQEHHRERLAIVFVR